MKRLFSLALAIATAACGGASEDEGPRPTLSLVTISPDSMVYQPLLGSTPLQPEVIAASVSRGLVKLDGAGQVVPDMATSWRVSDDGRSIIFRLREAAWSDGRAVKGEDFVRMFRAALAPSSRHPFKNMLKVIENGADIAAGRKPASALGVSSPIDDAVEIRLDAPRPNFLQLIAQPGLGLSDRNMSKVALGPFRLTRNANNHITLLPNPDFSDPGSIPFGRIDMQAQQDAAMALQRFRVDRADVLMGGTTGDFQLARAAGLDRFLRLDPVHGVYGYRPLRMDGPLGDVRIRRALAMVIDRDGIAASTGAATAQPLVTMLPHGLSELEQPTMPEWASQSPAERLQAATALMAEARGKDAAQPLTLKIALPNGPTHVAILAQVSAAWRPLGIILQAVRANDDSADLGVMDTITPGDTISWLFDQLSCTDKGYCSKPALELLNEARTARDLPTRRAMLARLDQFLTVDQAFIPLITPIRWSMVDAAVLGWTDNPTGQHPLWALSRISGQPSAPAAALSR